MARIDDQSILNWVQHNLNDWVQRNLGEVPDIRDSKAIHCSVLGTHVFARHEIAMLDTPLLQRLRYISQTGFVYLTFPGARHSRYEHTLGTVILAERYINSLNQRGKDKDEKEVIDPTTADELRMAALLHDVGHCFFSHASELVYGKRKEFSVDFKKIDDISDAGAHEIVSYLIVTSQPFRTFFAELCSKYKSKMDIDRIAGWIIGRPHEPGKAYLAEVINGPFDVDKLDYIHRDAHATGLRLVVDLDRFFYAVDTTLITREDYPDLNPGRHLVLRSVQPLEQMVFSKMMLFSTVYHHHKVKACDCLLAGAVQYENNALAGMKLDNQTPCLDLTEGEILGFKQNPNIKRIRERQLIHRIAELSVNTVEGWRDESERPKEPEPNAKGTNVNPKIFSLDRHINDRKHPENLTQLNSQIYQMIDSKVRSNIRAEEIWVDIPPIPKLKEVSQALVLMGSKPIVADKVFPTRGWLTAYAAFRHQGHIFGPREYASQIFDAAQAVLADSRFSININKQSVADLCHWT